MEGQWREHLKLLQNFEDTIHLFYMPEIHIQMIPFIKELAVEGNTSIKHQAVYLLAKILQYQHHVPAREELIEFILTRIANSKNFSHRRAYIEFCSTIIKHVPFLMFK